MKRPNKILTAFIIAFIAIALLAGVQAALFFEQIFPGSSFTPTQPASMTANVQYSPDNVTYSSIVSNYILGSPLYARLEINSMTGLSGKIGFVDFKIYMSDLLAYTITTTNFTYSGGAQIIYCPQQLSGYITTLSTYRIDARAVA